MRRIKNILLILPLIFLSHCMIFEMDEQDEEIPHDSIGFLEIEFIIPEYQIPKDKIHIVDLSIAYNEDSAFNGLFIRKANVSDSKRIYRFELLEREYFYLASITCACLGDTCQDGGFPGGRYSLKYSVDNVVVEGGKTLRYYTSYD